MAKTKRDSERQARATCGITGVSRSMMPRSAKRSTRERCCVTTIARPRRPQMGAVSRP
jgi:hypothetical protein